MPYDIHSLRPDERERAYVLIRIIKPGVDLEQWQSFLASTEKVGSSCGITVASVSSDHLVGLFTWEMQPNLDHGKVFAVDNLIATGALDPEPLLAAMMDQIEGQARELSCAAIQVSLPSVYGGLPDAPRDQPMIEGFLDNGFAVVDHKLCKECSPANGRILAGESAPRHKGPDALS